jgi:hypothetical protein
MSEFSGVGIATALDGPLPVAPSQSLLNTPGVVAEAGRGLDGERIEIDRALGGVNVWMYPTGCSELWEPCSDGTFRVKDDASTQLAPRFDSFVVYKSITCSVMGMDDASLRDLARRASVVLNATLSAGVERALAEGVAGLRRRERAGSRLRLGGHSASRGVVSGRGDRSEL